MFCKRCGKFVHKGKVCDLCGYDSTKSPAQKENVQKKNFQKKNAQVENIQKKNAQVKNIQKKNVQIKDSANNSTNEKNASESNKIIISLFIIFILICLFNTFMHIIVNISHNRSISAENYDIWDLNEFKKLTEIAIENAASDINVVSNDNGTTKTAIYILEGDGWFCNIKPVNSEATWEFADCMMDVVDSDFKTVSHVDSHKKAVKVTVTGCAVDGFSVTAEYTELIEKSDDEKTDDEIEDTITLENIVRQIHDIMKNSSSYPELVNFFEEHFAADSNTSSKAAPSRNAIMFYLYEEESGEYTIRAYFVKSKSY